MLSRAPLHDASTDGANMTDSLPHTPLLREAAERGVAYLAGLSERAVGAPERDVARLQELEQPLPDGPTEAREVLRLLDRLGSPATVASAGGRYFGFVIGGSHPAGVAAHWLATAWDQNAVFHATSPAAATLERIAFAWVLDALRLPRETVGGFVTGTTMANVAALAAARRVVLGRAGWDVERDGLFGAPPIELIASEQAHATLWKSLRLLGLGSGHVVRVPADEHGRIIAARIPKCSGPAIVCAQAGHVDSGAFDVLPDVVDAARASAAWVHLDGAFGLWARAAPERAQLVAGLELVDSCATDLHKWLNVPYDNGVYLVRGAHADALRTALAMHGPYFPADGMHDPGRLTPDSSRRARGVDAWAVLRALGRSGLAELIERTCRFAARFAQALRAAGYEVLNDVVLNQVLVAFGDDDATRAVIRAVQDDGTCWCGGTTWRGRAAMRISVSSWATTAEDVERSLAAIVRLAQRERERVIR
jgi:glutamate/tyrosine decarboxylase-like PLP-dependent enzyme